MQYHIYCIATGGGLQLSITTWYMGESNYRDVAEGRSTRIYAPFISTAANSISIFAFAYFKGGSTDCYFWLEGQEHNIIKADSETRLPGGNGYRFRYDIRTVLGTSRNGWYVFTCARSKIGTIRRRLVYISIIIGIAATLKLLFVLFFNRGTYLCSQYCNLAPQAGKSIF